MKRATLILLIFAMLVAPAACGLRDSPEGAAKEWLEALASFDGLKMDERTCSEQKEQLQQGGALLAAFSALGQEITDQNVRIDVSAVNLSTTKSTADTANVHVTGKIRASVGLLVQSQPVDEDWKMVKEGGKWAWCGEALASAVPVAPGSFEVQADQEWQDTGT